MIQIPGNSPSLAKKISKIAPPTVVEIFLIAIFNQTRNKCAKENL